MESALVTVITPVYNAERYIEKCVSSVLGQTYPSWEQIIVDDGSTDATPERVARFKDPRIKYLRLPHRGLSALADSYNTALRAGHGPLVAILEGDDRWPPNKLAAQVPGFDDARVQITWGDATVIDDHDLPLWRWPHASLFEREMGMDALFRRLTRANILTPAVTVMVRRSALDAIGGFQQFGQALFVDLPTWLMVSATATGTARKLDACLGYYRMHEAQVSASHAAEMQSNQAAIAGAALRKLDPAALKRLGWSERHLRAANASGHLWQGIARLQSGDRKKSRADLVEALLGCASAREKLRASLGLLSTVVNYDLVTLADRARRAALLRVNRGQVRSL